MRGKESILSIVRYLAITILTFVVVAFFALVTVNISFLSPIARVVEDFSMSDFYYQAMQSGKQEISQSVTIVDMTELTDRKLIAMALEEVEEYNPKVVGVDILFQGLKDDGLGNMMIQDVASRYGNIVFAFNLTDYDDKDGTYGSELHSFFVDSISVVEGYTNFEGKINGGIKRKLSFFRMMNGEDRLSFTSRVFEKYAAPVSVNLHREDKDIYFLPTSYPVVSYDSIADYSHLIEDRIVLFGGAHDETDMKYTPIGKMAGINLLAYALSTVIDGRDVKPLPVYLMLILSFIIVLLTTISREQYLHFIESRMRNVAVKAFFSSSMVVGVLTFMWMVLLVWCGFMIFGTTGWDFNMGLALSAIAFIGPSVAFYDICVKSFKSK